MSLRKPFRAMKAQPFSNSALGNTSSVSFRKGLEFPIKVGLAIVPLALALLIVGFWSISSSLEAIWQPGNAAVQTGYTLSNATSEKLKTDLLVSELSELEPRAFSQRSAELRNIQSGSVRAQKGRLWSAWTSYKRSHAKALREGRVVLYTPWQSGHGNRLPGVVTAFMLALLTKRALLIDYCACVRKTEECKCQWSDLFDQGELEVDAVSLLERNSVLKGIVSKGSYARVDFLNDAGRLNLHTLAGTQVLMGNGSMDWTGEGSLLLNLFF